jgi:hypothetical protein
MNYDDGNRFVEREPAAPRCPHTMGDIPDGERCGLRAEHDGNHQFVIEFHQTEQRKPPEVLR